MCLQASRHTSLDTYTAVAPVQFLVTVVQYSSQVGTPASPPPVPPLPEPPPQPAASTSEGSVAYFTGVGPNGPGVFSAPSSGGSVQEIASGAAFGAPFGIALSTDGKTLFVADPGASGTTLDGGRILAVDAEQGMVTPV